MNIISSGSSIEDAVNRLVSMGVSRGHILGEILRIARYLLGNPGIVLIDAENDGNLTGVVFGDPLLIETVAELCKTENWALTDMPSEKRDDPFMNIN